MSKPTKPTDRRALEQRHSSHGPTSAPGPRLALRHQLTAPASTGGTGGLLTDDTSTSSSGSLGSGGSLLGLPPLDVVPGDGGGGGYDVEFSPPADQRFVCPVCMLVMRRPIQTPCGHRFCAACISQWIRQNECSDCPTCKNRLDEQSLFHDNFAHREILSLTVKCTNSKAGCTTVVELRNIQTHLNSECLYALCPCPNRCTAILLKKDLESHLTNVCTSRKFRCSFCNEQFLLHNKELHLASCPKKLEVCPLCGKQLLKLDVC